MMFPKVVLLILNWNNAVDTIACLRSVEVMDYPNSRTVVIDNGSTDRSVQAIRQCFPDLEILEIYQEDNYNLSNQIKKSIENLNSTGYDKIDAVVVLGSYSGSILSPSDSKIINNKLSKVKRYYSSIHSRKNVFASDYNTPRKTNNFF